jgi:hypothetical protein
MSPEMPPIAAPALSVLVAGLDKDERGAVEAAVRNGLGSRLTAGPWSVSVVHLGAKWSVTVDGGGLRSASAMTDRGSLADAIRRLVDGGGAGALSPAPPSDAPGVEVRDRHACERCGRGVLVVYEARPGETKEFAPVACPHCWAVGHVEVGAWAAAGQEYRCEKA